MRMAVVGLRIYSKKKKSHEKNLRTTERQSVLYRFVYPQPEKTKVQFLLTPIHLFH